jgi:hypothetical protein
MMRRFLLSQLNQFLDLLSRIILQKLHKDFTHLWVASDLQ